MGIKAGQSMSFLNFLFFFTHSDDLNLVQLTPRSAASLERSVKFVRQNRFVIRCTISPVIVIMKPNNDTWAIYIGSHTYTYD